MESGKFYNLLINKDNANFVVLAPPSPIQFEGNTYIAIPLTTHHSLEIWQIERFGEQEKHTNITHSVDWFIMQPSNTLVIQSSKPLTGYVKFI